MVIQAGDIPSKRFGPGTIDRNVGRRSAGETDRIAEATLLTNLGAIHHKARTNETPFWYA
jgi:hypothetical protein